MKLVGEPGAAGVEVEVGRDDLLAINGALNWILNAVRADIPGLDQGGAKALLRVVHDACDRGDEALRLALSWVELRAIDAAVDGPLSEDVGTVTGVPEERYLRVLDEVRAVVGLAP